MKLTSQWTGLDIARAFSQLAAPIGHDVAIEELKKAAEPMRADAAASAPRDSGPGPHLADHIVIAETTRLPGGRSGRWRDTNEHEHVIAVGPSHRPDDVFWGKFQEFGTAHHPAQPFLRPAFSAGAKRALEAAALGIGRNLMKRLKGRT